MKKPTQLYRVDSNGFAMAILRRHKVPGQPGRSEGYSWYSTRDDRFHVHPYYDRGAPNGTAWQIRARDGSKPWRLPFSGGRSGVLNCDTLAEARDELGMLYAAEAETVTQSTQGNQASGR